MEGSNYRIHFIVGLICLAVMVGVSWGVYAHVLTDGNGGETYRIDVRFRHLSGLKKGAPVRLSGADVGSVEHITVADPDVEHSQPAFLVTLRLDNLDAYRRWIRTDSKFMITTKGLLGDSLVQITWGSEEGRILQNGETVEGSGGGSLDAETFDDLSETLSNVKTMSAELETMLTAQGDQGVPQIVENLNATLANVEQMSQELQGTLEYLDTTLHNAATLTEDARTAFGPDQAAQVREAIADFRDAAANLDEVSDRAKVGVEQWIDLMEKMRFWD